MRTSIKPTAFLFLALVLALAAPLLAGAGLDDLKKEFKKAIEGQNTDRLVTLIGEMGALDDEPSAKYLLELLVKVDQFRFRYAEYKDSPLKIPEKGTKEQIQQVIDRQKVMDEALAKDDEVLAKVYGAVKSALEALGNDKALAELVDFGKKAQAQRWEARVAVIEVLTKVDGDKAEGAIIAALDDKRPEVARSATRALGQRHSLTAMPVLIKRLKRLEKQGGEEWIDLRNALTAITGEDFKSAVDWQSYWDTKGKGFDPEKDRGGKVNAGSTVERETPTFFGTEVTSLRVVFVIDVSGSMHIKDPIEGGESDSGTTDGSPVGGAAKPKGGQKGCTYPECDKCDPALPASRMRIERVKVELIKLIKQLDPDVKFNILAFTTACRSWKNRELLPANEANKQDAIKFTSELHYLDMTSTDYALTEAFENQEADTFYLLSDGSPYRGALLPLEPIYTLIETKNRARHVKIHTLGIQGANTPFMEHVASMTGGKYASVR